MGLHRPATSPAPHHSFRARLLHRAPRATPARVVGRTTGPHPWSATSTIAAYRAQRAIQPW